MSLLLSHIKGETLESIERTDAWHLSFGDVFLAIFNPVKVVSKHAPINPFCLKGLVVENVIETETDVTIVMSGDFSLQVDLRPQAYTGPEAMVLHIAGNGFIVWN